MFVPLIFLWRPCIKNATIMEHIRLFFSNILQLLFQIILKKGDLQEKTLIITSETQFHVKMCPSSFVPSAQRAFPAFRSWRDEIQKRNEKKKNLMPALAVVSLHWLKHWLSADSQARCLVGELLSRLLLIWSAPVPRGRPFAGLTKCHIWFHRRHRVTWRWVPSPTRTDRRQHGD